MAMKTPPIVTSEEWEAARQQLLVKEKALTKSRDALAAERRRMPWMPVEKAYEFVYSRFKENWRLAMGTVDDELSIVFLKERNGQWEIAGIVRLDIGEDRRIDHISDYQHCPWLLTAGSIAVRT